MPRIEVKETDDEHNHTPTGGVFLVLKGDELLLDTTELECITREEWDAFLAKAQGHAGELGIAFVNTITDLVFEDEDGE